MLVDDFKGKYLLLIYIETIFVILYYHLAKMTEAKSFLQPIIQQEKEGKVPDCDAMNFVHTMYHLILK